MAYLNKNGPLSCLLTLGYLPFYYPPSLSFLFGTLCWPLVEQFGLNWWEWDEKTEMISLNDMFPLSVSFPVLRVIKPMKHCLALCRNKMDYCPHSKSTVPSVAALVIWVLSRYLTFYLMFYIFCKLTCIYLDMFGLRCNNYNIILK